jgi:hypothetical protein
MATSPFAPSAPKINTDLSSNGNTLGQQDLTSKSEINAVNNKVTSLDNLRKLHIIYGGTIPHES